MTTGKVTDDAIAELKRTLAAFQAYRDWNPAHKLHSADRANHAAAYRASLDLARALARWRDIVTDPVGKNTKS